jgi:MOSC domain-containing protein YiiM
VTIDQREVRAIGTIVSVNVGEPREIEWAGRIVRTAIWKWPTDGRVTVRHDNLDGDGQADRRAHGGPEKAVYAYAAEDYRWWEGQLHSSFDPGTFGENLTTEGIDLAEAVIGEVWGVGSARLRVAQTRQPCFKLGIRMGDAGFVQEFERARLFGVYLRIDEVGAVGAGDDILLISRPAHGLTAAGFADILDSRDPEDLQRFIDIDEVPDSVKTWARRQLARGGSGGR